MAKNSTPKKAAANKAPAKKSAAKKAVKKAAPKKAAGIGRSAITGKFMSVSSAKAHKKTAIIHGGKGKA